MFTFSKTLLGAVKAALPAAALALGLSTAGSSQAASYLIDRGDLPDYRVLNIAGIGNVLGGPILFDGKKDGVQFFDLLAFCVDVYHEIGTGDYNPDLKYTDTVELTFDSNTGGILTHFSGPTGLSVANINLVGQIVNFGALAFYDHGITSGERLDRVAAAQGAIWEVVSGKNVTGSGLDARINQYAAGNFGGAYGTIKSNFDLIVPPVYPAAAGTQAFAFAIPEPAAWSLMIIGFGAAGAMVRARRRMML